MIKIGKKEDCCGCNACGDVCPQGAISFKRDVGEFLYPEVDLEKCVQCGLCEEVCPQLHADDLRVANPQKMPKAYAAIAEEVKLRFESTSGGMFSVLADKILSEGGFVGGAVWNEEFFVCQIVTENPDDMQRLRCSKYSQSDARGFYRAVKEAAETGRPILVCGTPCQMAALRLFLRREYENLIVVDFVCRNVPAPLAFRKYVDWVEGQTDAKVVAVQQKNKEFGWRRLATKFTLDNGRLYYDAGGRSLFMQGFVGKDLFSRPTCYECKFRGFPRMADITIADCWGIVESLPKDMDGDLGTSLVLCNTSKGSDFFRLVGQAGGIKVHDVDEALLFKFNPGITHSISRAAISQEDLFEVMRTQGIAAAMEGVQPVEKKKKTVIAKVKSKIKGGLFRLRRIWSLRKNFLQTVRINGWKQVIAGRPLLIPVGNVVWQQDKTAKLNVSHDFRFGRTFFVGSALESRMLMRANTELTLKGGNHFSYGANIEIFAGGRMEIGSGFHANINCTINCGDYIKIGDNVNMGRNVSIRDTHGHTIGTTGFKMTRPVEIGDHVWIASEAMIMPGVHIGSGAIVGARSLVLHDVPAGALVVGSPARVVRSGIQFKM